MKLNANKNIAKSIVVINMLIVIGALMIEDVNGEVDDCVASTECWISLEGKNPPPPTKECCDAIKTQDHDCMCRLAKSLIWPGFEVDNKTFLALFGKCGLPSCS
ncbi:hypothetical protein RND81_10G234100 [Saponaria officinalis]|uniref:Bifunctional inhibitor/plant lipid transfer protein/seed storage helical domain-containing protein n=1 Tax=Saponaria officinalis TaxID=3572 RepID=A0AAW1I798_SAPOF